MWQNTSPSQYVKLRTTNLQFFCGVEDENNKRQTWRTNKIARRHGPMAEELGGVNSRGASAAQQSNKFGGKARKPLRKKIISVYLTVLILILKVVRKCV
jgi:hypothetical protein